MQRLMNALGLTTVRSLMVSWGVSAVVLVVGLMLLLLTASTVPGLVLFVLGAAGSLLTSFFVLRLRAGDVPRRRRAPE